mmetsp:Transcript_51945/g.135615  ORF Transcript_51945/g.135615 Transcript_51945/m.135615 type:complete len:555 (-) Transcript_51945:428-2092(-)
MDQFSLEDAQAPSTVVSNPTIPIALLASSKQRFTKADGNYIDPGAYQCSSGLWSGDGLALVTRSDPIVVASAEALAHVLISPSFINFVALFLLVNLVVAHITWILERRKNPDQFNPSYFLGVLDGLWFALVTVTTVGYGDKVPKSGLGRLVTSVWMLLGLIAFSVMGGQAISGISAVTIMYQINSISDVVGALIGVFAPYRPEEVASAFGFRPLLCDRVLDCANKIQSHDIHGFIAPAVEYRAFLSTWDAANTSCGNPLTTVGDRLRGGDPIFGNFLATCMCETCNSINYTEVSGTLVYAASYLQAQINMVLSDMALSGDLDTFNSNLEASDVSFQCGSTTQFDLNLIISCLVVSSVYAFAVMGRNLQVVKHLMARLSSIFIPMRQGASKALHLGVSFRRSSVLASMPLEEVEESDDDKSGDGKSGEGGSGESAILLPPGMAQDYAATEAAASAMAAAAARRRNRRMKREFNTLKLACNTQLDRMGKVEGEVVVARRRLLRVARTLLLFGVGGLVAFTAGVASLIMVWGTQVQPSALGLSSTAQLLTINSADEL